MGEQEAVWWSGGGVYLEGLPELISQSADLRDDVTNEEGLWHAAAPQREQVLHQPLCSLELRFGETKVQSADSSSLYFIPTSFTYNNKNTQPAKPVDSDLNWLWSQLNMCHLTCYIDWWRHTAEHKRTKSAVSSSSIQLSMISSLINIFFVPEIHQKTSFLWAEGDILKIFFQPTAESLKTFNILIQSRWFSGLKAGTVKSLTFIL